MVIAATRFAGIAAADAKFSIPHLNDQLAADLSQSGKLLGVDGPLPVPVIGVPRSLSSRIGLSADWRYEVSSTRARASLSAFSR